jgi:hypothetical protein
MKNLLLLASLITALCTVLWGCQGSATTGADAGHDLKDTTHYAFTATYSSDLNLATDPAITQEVLHIWKCFETGQIQAMAPYFADTVTYEDAGGMHFHGKSSDLLAYAAKDIADLDSMRFDISMWHSIHVNDKNEDWVNIWSTERRYPKNGSAKADTFLMQENWKVAGGKVVYFDQYTRKLYGR